MNDGDEYLQEVAVFSEERLNELKSSCSISLDGDDISVQPIGIVLSNNEALGELDDVNKTMFKAKIAVDGISVSSCSQQGADDYASITTAKANVTDNISIG